MKLLAARTGGSWQDLSPAAQSVSDPAAVPDGQSNQVEDVGTLLSDLLLAENVLVLCGLGASMEVVDPSGKRLAPGMRDLWNQAVKDAGADFDEICNLVRYSGAATDENIEALLSACHTARTFVSDKRLGTFISRTEKMIVDRCRFLSDSTPLDTHEAFLRKIGRRSTRQPRTKVFTTNYDLCLETAASRIRFVVVDGFSHTSPQEFDGSYFGYDLVRREEHRDAPDYIPNVMHLYKLHGSVDWVQREGRILREREPASPLLIYPRSSKFENSYEQPFLEMMARFQMSLRAPNTSLLVLGFGFNDAHISQPILSAIQSNVSLRCVIVDPALEATTNRYLTSIRSLVEQGDRRLGLVAGTFKDIVRVLPELTWESESDAHAARLQRARTRP